MDIKTLAAGNLAARLLAKPWTRQSITAILKFECPGITAEDRRVLGRSVLALGAPYPPSPAALADHLRAHEAFKPTRPFAIALAPPRFAPASAFAGLALPCLATRGDLAAWLDLSMEHLAWFTDERRAHGRAETPKFQHYHYAFRSKSNGAQRLIEAPKFQMKALQRRILRGILAGIPVHDAAHGFVAGRSALTGAQGHAAEAALATFDLSNFFPGIALPRVHGLFRALGYPYAVARALAGICTTITPAAVLARLRGDAASQVFSVPHLPQGAPTSPMLANLLAWRLDRRLAGLARAACAHYTRYADDLVFSGDVAFSRALPNFSHAVAAISAEEGFRLNTLKTRIMPASARQIVTGIVVNRHCNVSRHSFDALKAILHNCVTQGPMSQNRTGELDYGAHLAGRVEWVKQINPRRGDKLQRLFEHIVW